MKLSLTKTTKLFLSFLMGLMMFSSIFATTNTNGQIGDVDVKVDSNGKLTVTGGGMNHASSAGAMNAFISKYKTVIVGISGVGAISMIAFFIYNFLQLGAKSTNPSERAKVLSGLIWSGLAAAGLGAVSMIVGFFYNSIK